MSFRNSKIYMYGIIGLGTAFAIASHYGGYATREHGRGTFSIEVAGSPVAFKRCEAMLRVVPAEPGSRLIFRSHQDGFETAYFSFPFEASKLEELAGKDSLPQDFSANYAVREPKGSIEQFTAQGHGYEAFRLKGHVDKVEDGVVTLSFEGSYLEFSKGAPGGFQAPEMPVRGTLVQRLTSW